MKYRIPLIKRAMAATGGKLKLFASPWSPPAFMKSNGSMLKGGTLVPAFRQPWANYYVKFVQAYEKAGVPVWGLSIQNEPFIGRRVQADGSITAGSTINDAYAIAMSEIGSRVQGAVYLSGVSTSVAAEAEQQRSGQAGVNLDEEASRLIQFQQAYQAAAKVLQTAQTLFSELLKLSGG